MKKVSRHTQREGGRRGGGTVGEKEREKGNISYLKIEFHIMPVILAYTTRLIFPRLQIG